MNFSNKVAITVIALFVSSVANADARLQVEIVPGRGALSETSIALNLLNVGDQTALVDKSSVPTVNGRGMLLDDPFILKQEDGREAEFIGIMRDTLPEVSRSFSIPAGGTFSVDIELAKGYRLSPGLSYKVSLRAPVSYRSGEGRSGSAKSSQQRADKWISAYPAARTIVVPVTGHTIGRASADEFLDPVVCSDPAGTPPAQRKSAVFQSVLVGGANGAGIALTELQQMT